MALGAKVASTAREARRIRGQGSFETGLQSGFPSSKCLVVAIWDDTVDGHIPIQVANGGLGLGVWVPANTFITIINFEVQVAPLGPTNMFASLEADFDLVPSLGTGIAPWATTGMKNGANIGASAVNVAQTVQGPRTTTAREVQIGGTVAASTTGRIVFFLEGVFAGAATQGIS